MLDVNEFDSEAGGFQLKAPSQQPIVEHCYVFNLEVTDADQQRISVVSYLKRQTFFIQTDGAKGYCDHYLLTNLLKHVKSLEFTLQV